MGNINDMVTVRLTAEGRKVLRKHYGKDHLKYINSRIKRSGKYQTELWFLMSVFGPFIHMGGQQMFKKNEIKIEVP